MLLEKPEDVKHENSSGTVCAIYGVDAHPTLQLFATAGGDNAVKIWSLQPPPEGGIATFELLATLANHQQAVNCVRWASHGRYLASGSDDQLVLLYELQSGAAAPVPFGSNAKRNKQNWVRCSTLERHTMDVADVAWSPDDRMLATCSIDNTILIWDVGVGGFSEVMTQPLQTLTGHNGWVKGVAWDPVGKYLSSAGEDKTVRMWKVADWQESDVVTEPFEGCASTSHFRRLSWSPDGSVLCATHAFSSKKNIAALLNRGSWTNDLKFVGHQSVVTSARFNPKLLVTKADPDKQFACCAVGGDDATFGGDEIGTPISDAQQSKLLQAKYGSRAGITLASTLVENPIQLQDSSANNPASSQNNIRNILGPTIVSPTASDVTLLDARMASTSGKEPSSAPGHSEKTGSGPKEKPAAMSSNDTSSKSLKMEVKKNGADGVSLKRKREVDRPPTQAAAVVVKSREVVARAPKLLNERLQFSVEIDTSTHSGSSGSNSNGKTSNGLMPSKTVVEATVHNLKNPQPEEIIGNASYWAIGVHNGDLLILNSSGRRLFPCIALGSAISVMECSVSDSPYLLVILVTGDLKIWDLEARKLILSSSVEAITNIGPLRRLQNASGYGRTQRGIASAMLSGMADPLMQRNVTRSHLEHQVAASIVLKSSTEYRYWVQAYARFLTHDEDVTRLDDLCAEMMGPFHAPSTRSTADVRDGEWAPMVLDLVKRDVLKSHILPTIAANRALQRVVTKYQLMLSEIEAREKEENDENES
uniref:Protein HIRA n=1 Tax=Phytophthora ramorum TaxID=164328 RepID=H3HDH6_PHYRM